MDFDLIIFDCDGTLVDSEKLYNTIASELLTDIGLPEYTPEECFRQFSGRSWSAMLDVLEERHAITISRDIVDDYIRRANESMATDLKPVAHVDMVLAALQGQASICVASNGEYNTVLKSLKVTGLHTFFPDHHVFSKIQVARPKPAPDLFLWAAQQMGGFEPARCLVIEDSVAGVQAGVAAGMHTVGFYGTALDGGQHKLDQESAGAHKTVACVREILDFIAA